MQTGTRDAQVIDRTLKRIPEEEWKEVDSMLSLLPGNAEPGLYFLIEENERLKAVKVDQ
jgi:hypothetical protein